MVELIVVVVLAKVWPRDHMDVCLGSHAGQRPYLVQSVLPLAKAAAIVGHGELFSLVALKNLAIQSGSIQLVGWWGLVGITVQLCGR